MMKKIRVFTLLLLALLLVERPGITGDQKDLLRYMPKDYLHMAAVDIKALRSVKNYEDILSLIHNVFWVSPLPKEPLSGLTAAQHVDREVIGIVEGNKQIAILQGNFKEADIKRYAQQQVAIPGSIYKRKSMIPLSPTTSIVFMKPDIAVVAWPNILRKIIDDSDKPDFSVLSEKSFGERLPEAARKHMLWGLGILVDFERQFLTNMGYHQMATIQHWHGYADVTPDLGLYGEMFCDRKESAQALHTFMVDRLATVRESVLLQILGLKSYLDGITLSQKENMVSVACKMTSDQFQILFGILDKLILLVR